MVKSRAARYFAMSATTAEHSTTLYIHTHKERDMADYCCHLVMPIECLRNNRDEYILFLFSLIIYMIIR